MARYVIRGGQEGYDRLLMLARDRWPDTSALLERAGVSAGMRAVDLGCGGGEVTLEIARLVGPSGQVTGVDMDPVKIELARAAAVTRGLDNVEFRILDVDKWAEENTYDVVYCRFLLEHLSDPVVLLRRMWAAVRAGGVLVVEDADFDGWCCHPPNEGFDFFQHAYAQVLARRGGDHAIGRKLLAHLLAAGVPRPHLAVMQPMTLEGEGKTLALSTLDASGEAILAEGVASEAELRDALDSLAILTTDPDSLISGPRIFQAWSRRPRT